MTSNKKRRYGDLAQQPLPKNDPTLIDEVFEAFTGRKPNTLTEPDPAVRETVPSLPLAVSGPAIVAFSEAGAPDEPVRREPVSPPEPVRQANRSIAKTDRFFIRLPQVVFDVILPQLDPFEQSVYLRLFRLSHGFHQATCRVGMSSLSKACNVKETKLRECLRRLTSLGLIEVQGVENSKEVKGTTYLVHTSINFTPVRQTNPSKLHTGAPDEPNTRNMDDGKKTYHHQKPQALNTDDDRQIDSLHLSQVKTCYQEITGNAWTAKDTKAYAEIAAIPVPTIEAAIRVAFNRAPAPPRSLAYFIPEIKTQHEPPRHNRVGNKKQLREIAEEVRTRFVGYSLSVGEFAEQIKHLAANRGINYGGGVLDEVLVELERKKN